ncbi:UDP-N-acetylglucosamine 2-epimerase [Micractinium conductrix]|uniref:UDP-N-acetylglucosamine 2-epimerase n=1 Tax=Micractinium conductrix TaxID=554055 RepID=A0A2P6V5R8_9CHLO|nr:UDP-N-acetylglucosamine 2-epimerase [Micractinium conductrix]|eukprot:PSC69428.1 UDP-N-acetylglucosamine 2-epimerase [Micractinium conductrix]
MRVHYTEPAIAAALDAACSELVGSQQLSEGKAQACQRFIAEHRRPLEDRIFGEGIEGLAAWLCTERASLCDPHTLVDSGEL